MNGTRLLISAAIIFGTMLGACGSHKEKRESLLQMVSRIQQADYEGNQTAMQKSYDQLEPFISDEKLASRVRYWRGFAQWRRAINGFNDSVDPKELEQDLKQAIDEFKDALAKDPTFVDAKIGTISCLGYLAFMNRKDRGEAMKFFTQSSPLIQQAKEEDPDNPRLLWVLGPILWNTPPERGGGQDKAIENYGKGLEIIRTNKATADPLEPSWGEPELLMNRAWSNANRTAPDLDAAERDARAALAMVPFWHYVRDILLPQIIEAKTKSH